METHYWWHNDNLKKLENGEYFIKNPELEAKIGNLIFEYPEWQGPGLRVHGSKGGQTEVYQVPRNCGNMIMANIGGWTDKHAAMQDFITRNIASACGYNILNASCTPDQAKRFENLGTGWKIYATHKANRSVGKDMAFMVNAMPVKDMTLKGYAFNQDKFYPVQFGEKKAGARQW